MRITFILILSLITSSLIAQSDSIPSSYLKDYKQYYKNLKQHDVPAEFLENYSQDNAYTKFNYTFYHKIYYNQPVLVAYVRSIVERLEPNKAIIDSLDIYITRSTQFNAFTIADGSVFVNIAALAQMSSEAELAYLLAHEYAHYKLEHVKEKYLRSREAGVKGRNVRPMLELSQMSEIQADSMALIMGKEAGYDYRAMDMLIQRLVFLQKKGYLQVKKEYNEHDIIPSTHPIGEKRLEVVKLLMSGPVEGELFPLGKDRFERIQRLAEFEYLKLLDEDFNLHDMISYPLKRFLLTGEDHYLPTLVRGIRKAMLINPTIIKHGFMTTQFLGTDRFKKKENIIHHLYYEYPDTNEVKIMHETAALDFDNVPFYNFEHAFKYFADTAVALGYQEPLLDVALHYGIKSPKGRKAIAAYLKDPNNLYHEYANKLKKKKLLEEIKEGRKIVLYGGLNHFEYKKNWMHHNSLNDFRKRHQSIASIRSTYEEKNMDYEVFAYKDFIQSNRLGGYMRIIEQLIYSGNGKKIMDYDPRLYYALTKEDIKSIEFVRTDHLSIRGRRLRLLALVPPFTLFGAYYGLMYPHAYTKHFSVTNYYGLDNDGKDLIFKTQSWLKTGAMSNERAEKLFYRFHRNSRRGYKLFLGLFKTPQ